MRCAGLVLLMSATLLAEDDKKTELRRAEIRNMLAAQLLRLSSESMGGATAALELGRGTQDEVRAARQGVHEARVEYELRGLDLKEVGATGRAPDDAISAPKVGERDFVLDRLRLAFTRDELREKAASAALDTAKSGLKKGQTTPKRVLVLSADLEVRSITVNEIRELLKLRRKFIAGESDKAEAEKSAAFIRADARIDRARVRLAVAKQLEDRAREAYEAKMALPLQVLAAEVERVKATAEFDLAKLERDVLRKHPPK